MKRVVVLGIDGVPYGFLKQLIARKEVTHFARLAAEADFRQMDSVHPTVSSVAWTSFVTGRNPGKHGLYGFVDRAEGAYDITIPLSTTVQSKTIWEVLSDAGKRVFGMNVPVTYPPREVNGILIGGFLCPSIDKVTRSPEVVGYLKSIDYQVDTDAMLARRSRDLMLPNVMLTLEKRMEAMFHYLASERWDYFHVHVMASDRLCHFLLGKYEAGDATYADAFVGFFRKLDAHLGRLLDELGDDCALVVLSDHGFCTIKSEVQLSRYLVEEGWTSPAADGAKHPLDIDASRSRAYSLIPGRVWVNVRGREPGGVVEAEDYDAVRDELASTLLALRAPNGDAVIRQVLRREEVYWPAGATDPDPDMPVDEVLKTDTAFGRAADLIAIPHDGYDLKMGLAKPRTFETTELEGMHTFHDALILSRGVRLPEGRFCIHNVTRRILETMDVIPPKDMD